MGVFHVFWILQMVPNHATHHRWSAKFAQLSSVSIPTTIRLDGCRYGCRYAIHKINFMNSCIISNPLLWMCFWLLQSFTKYLRQTLVFMRNSALREKYNLWRLLLALTKWLFRDEDWALGIILWSSKIFLIFPNNALSRLSTREVNHIYQFRTNNHASFHLW